MNEVINDRHFKKGDTVRFKARIYGHPFELGETVVIEQYCTKMEHFGASKGGDMWFFREDEIEHVEIMKHSEIIHKKITKVQSAIDSECHIGKPIPNELILEYNKLLNDYNEAIKKENGNG